MCCGNANGYHYADACYKTYVADDHDHICDDNYTNWVLSQWKAPESRLSQNDDDDDYSMIIACWANFTAKMV